MKRTALYETHVELGGRMVDFAGWALPVQYPTGPTEEHHAVRTAAGLFDIDHMGQFEISGPDATAYLERVQVASLNDLEKQDATYSLICYADGTIVDDIFLYKLVDYWLMVVNASNREKDLAWLNSLCTGFDVSIADRSDDTYMLALQGPEAERILQKLTDADLNSLETRKAVTADVDGVTTLIGRTGYTGEDGFELYFSAEHAVKMWNDLLAAGTGEGLLPCGLGARDSLRFEASMPLYGHEISAGTNPIEARLGWAVDLDHDFIGRLPILKTKLEGPKKVLVGLRMLEKAVPREGYPVQVGEVTIGHITSGMRSTTIGGFLAMAYVDAAYSNVGCEVDVLIRNEPRAATVIKRPFYRRQP